MTKRMLTDDMLRAAVRAMVPDRIQGFSTPSDNRKTWGPPHYIRDVWKPPGEQELWRGNSHDEMIERCEMERLRLGINAALDMEHGENAMGTPDKGDMVECATCGASVKFGSCCDECDTPTDH